MTARTIPGKIVRIFLASSNPGKLREFQALSSGREIELELLPGFAGLPAFDESASTFAENSAGKALHYSRFISDPVMADDSGLVVAALGGAPGVHSARYAGPNATDRDRYQKLLGAMAGKNGADRAARFVCVLTLAVEGRAIAVISDAVEGRIASAPSGGGGFGYDPVFYLPELDKTYGEIDPKQKNEGSHRGRAFRKLLAFISSPDRTYVRP